MQWYYLKGKEQAGPVAYAELKKLAEAGEIYGETLVWREGLENWIAYESAEDESPSAQGASRLKLARDTDVSAASGAQPVTGDSAQGLSQLEDQAAGFMFYGGFWIRYVAKVLDGIFLLIISAGICIGLYMAGIPAFKEIRQFGNPQAMAAASFAINGVLSLLSLVYTVFFLGKFGATPGKMVCKLKVVLPNGSPIGYGRAFGRVLAEILSQLVLYIGYIIAAFDSEKRALHDHICGTRVVKR